jgi:polyribonucleotide nucleotidyltransferase
VPKAAVGVVIGKGGDMIKKLQQETGAKIQFIQMKDEGPGDRNCIINGKDDCVENARQRIQDMIDSVVVRFVSSSSKMHTFIYTFAAAAAVATAAAITTANARFLVKKKIFSRFFRFDNER